MATGADDVQPASGRRRAPGWERGFVVVPGWVASALILGVLLAIAVTALVLIPPAQRPYLEPATPSGSATPAPS